MTALIGAGGMGEVYKGRDARLDRSVAIKVLPPEMAGDPERRARFEREARAVAALDHPHICGIYDIGASDDIHYLVMPHLDGQTLAARLQRGPLPIDQALKIAGEIADALDKAHLHGIVHRDLKPANVILTKTGSKLLDFGLAKLRPSPSAISMSVMEKLATDGPATSHGTILGTRPYMAPEQVEGKEADARSDIWALGVVVYEMIAGRRPFVGDTPASVIGAILKDDPPPLSRIQPLAPPLLDQVVMRCLAKDPDDRWQSTRDLRTALAWSAETPQLTRRESPSRAGRVATLAALLAGGAALGWLVASVRAPAAPPRALSLEIGPPAGTEFVPPVDGGGSAISPDGNAVAFVARAEGIPRLWVRRLDSIVSRELPDTDGASFPFWSPDSRSLGYFAHGNLRRIEALGGASTVLTPVANPRGGTWGADGTIVFGESVGGLQRISASGGKRSPLTALAAGELSHRLPRFLPDGRTLFFFVQGDRPGVHQTRLDGVEASQRVVDSSLDAAYVAARSGGPGYVLTVQGDALVAQPFDLVAARITGPAFPIPGAGNVLTLTGANRSNLSVANDGSIVYAAGSNRYQVAWFGADGTALRNVGAPDRYVGLRVSPDGTEALTFVDDAVGNRDIWRLDVTSGLRNRVTSDNRGNFGTWFADGRRIAFTGQTRQTLFEKSTSGDVGDRAILRADYPIYPYDSSRDGRYLLFAQDLGGGHRYDVSALAIGESSNATAILQSPADELHAGFSPDGRLIAFSSDESGRDEVYIQTFPGATMRQMVSNGGGSYPRWSRRGSELFHRSLDGQLVTVPVRFDGASVQLGERRLVMRLIEPPALMVYPYDIAPDGRILALVPAPGAPRGASLAVLMNWQGALGERK